MATTVITDILTFRLNSDRQCLKSPVPSLLRSNDPPSDYELTRIQDAIAAIEAKLKDKSRDKPRNVGSCPYTKFLQSHKSILSPSRRLPTELLVEIFLHYLGGHRELKRNSPPWILGHICRRWRHIAVNTAALWRHLPPMRLGSLEKPQLKRQIACLSTLLTRSGDAGLTFFLAKTDTPTPHDAILTMLFEHSQRWERISLAISEDVCAHFSRVKGRLSSLQSLNLLLTRTGRLLVNMFEVAPKLREVRLGSVTWPGIIKLPWDQLSNFTEDSSHSNHLVAVLRSSATCLEKLNFITDQTWLAFNETANIRSTSLPNLTSLALQSPAETGLQSLLAALTVPALQEVVLRIFTNRSVVQEMTGMINRSACTLQRLVLHINMGHDVDQILKLTPLLTVLDINDPEPELIDALALLDPSTTDRNWTLLPCLVSLTIRLGPAFQRLKELSHLAQLRCDLSFAHTAAETGQDLLRLQVFKIASPPQIFGHRFDIAQFAHQYPDLFGLGSRLTGDAGVVAGDDKEVPKAAKRALDDELREITLLNRDFQMSRKGRLLRLSRHIEILMELLEKFEVTPETVTYLYLKRIDFTLERLLDLQMPLHTKIQYSKRVDALLAKWASTLTAMSSKLKWAWQKEGYLVYMPENDGASLDRGHSDIPSLS
ncbi:hypothetical protein BDZ97DRAFT_1912582 [Flammula alnicola]|nr:hypothetical protein BDZ97DRAFT_1912582 [Flammula alnicola]